MIKWYSKIREVSYKENLRKHLFNYLNWRNTWMSTWQKNKAPPSWPKKSKDKDELAVGAWLQENEVDERENAAILPHRSQCTERRHKQFSYNMTGHGCFTIFFTGSRNQKSTFIHTAEVIRRIPQATNSRSDVLGT